jgi:sulfur carrier protein ThiS adenylyltransferase
VLREGEKQGKFRVMPELALFISGVRAAARQIPRGDGSPCLRIAEAVLARLASDAGLSLREAQSIACEHEIWPERYVRNTSLFSAAEQAGLLRATVLQVGLGGLGGFLLDMLLRLGVGRIAGADGDLFEESNLNRQILATSATLGKAKARAAAEHAARINPAVEFTPIEAFLRGENLLEALRGKDLVLDALGGLKDRKNLHDAAAKMQVPMISTGIAGFVGWTAVVRPGDPGPADFLGQGKGVEESLGNPAPTVAFAAALQCAEAAKFLAGRACASGFVVFDLAEQSITRLAL